MGKGLESQIKSINRSISQSPATILSKRPQSPLILIGSSLPFLLRPKCFTHRKRAVLEPDCILADLAILM